MEPEASKAAISAIAALQQRIMELEKEESELTQEKSRLERQISSKDKLLMQKNKLMDEASQKAKEMLTYLSKAVNDLSEARNKNHKLKDTIRDIEGVFPTIGVNEEANRKQKTTLRQETSALINKCNDYEVLLSEYFRPSPLANTPTGALILAVSEKDPSLLPPEYSETYQTLLELPKNFREQPLSVKKDTIRILTDARAILNDINNQMKDVQKKRSKPNSTRFDSEYNKLAAQHLMISNEIGKISFS